MFYYKQVKNGQIISVEAKSRDSKSPNFIKTTKTVYDNFIASLPEPEPPEPTRLDILEGRVKALEDAQV